MALTFCNLGSGSTGNCTYIASETTSILIDAGFSGRETVRRLGLLDVAPETLSGIVTTHEHSDHIGGLRILHNRFRTPLFGNAGTIRAINGTQKNDLLFWNVFTTGCVFQVGDLNIESFPVSHDAAEPVGLVIRHEDLQIGVITDIGVMTHAVRERMRGCDIVMIESNHDAELLRDAPRPWSLKQRIMSRQGHLSNESAADTVAEIASPKLNRVYLAHLSEDCNRGELALTATRDRLVEAGHEHVHVCLTYPDRPSEIWQA
jgi:phosphoribosyl 1,2-cyclic phosphodiesterase